MPSIKKQLGKLAKALKIVAADGSAFSLRLFRSRAALAAENVFLRRQLALFQEHEQKAQRTTAADRFTLSTSARFFDWREALMIVKPATLIGWHRNAFRRFWRWKSRPVGRPPLSGSLREVIRQMAAENPNWGEKRIADELLLKLGLRVSPRTVAKYLKRQPGPRGSKDQRWSTFMRNQAQAIVACDFFVSVTVNLQVLYVFVVMEIGSRRLLHFNVSDHPAAEWTVQQLRETLPGDHPYGLVHDRHSSFSAELDKQVETFGVKVIRTPVRTPTANAYCERLIGSIRRECLDYVIPINEWHLRRILREWMTHYNGGRPHRALGPGIPDRPNKISLVIGRRHEIPDGVRLASKSILAGLHHEYQWEQRAA